MGYELDVGELSLHHEKNPNLYQKKAEQGTRKPKEGRKRNPDTRLRGTRISREKRVSRDTS